ncbi:hypothetical protein BH11MYX3_BH11MYX3_09790 [soil metagenome]
MVGYDGSVKVLDFGIAKAEERATKTVGGTIKGKYGYMSPEQCKGKPSDRRSDIFALGIVLYELTTLRRAFKGNDDFETMKRIVAGDVVLPTVAIPGYPRELEAIVLTAMANDPNARFQTGQELIEALDAFAVRAKLTGSNTAMGRFMTQLFGAKREPWVDAPPGEKTEISIEDDSDNEKTSIVAGPMIIPPEAMRPEGSSSRAQTETDNPDTMRGGSAPPQETDAAAWQQADVRQSARNVASPGPPARPYNATDTLTGAAPPPQHHPQTQPMYGAQPPQAYQQPYAQQPYSPPYPPQHQVPRAGSPPSLIGNEEISEVGAHPLVDDPRLGWSTSVNHKITTPSGAAGGTSMGGDAGNYNIRSNKGWILLAILLVLGAAGAIVAVALS